MGAYSSVHVKRCGVSCSCMLQRRQSGEASKGDLLVLICARVRRCALVIVASIVFIAGAVCSSLLIFLLLRYRS